MMKGVVLLLDVDLSRRLVQVSLTASADFAGEYGSIVWTDENYLHPLVAQSFHFPQSPDFEPIYRVRL